MRIRSLLSVVVFISQSYQVDILLHSTYTYTNAWNAPSTLVIEQQCRNHPPGVCCQCIDPNDYLPFKTAEFQHLLAGDIAATWMARSARTISTPDPVAGCNGIIADSRQGPGSWTFDFSAWLERALGSGNAWRSVDNTIAYGTPGSRAHDSGVVGASYISLPLDPNRDPDPKEHFMLEAQGLAWGGGKWFGKGFSMNALSSALPSRSLRRTIISPNQGIVYARAPTSKAYPSIVVVNNTSYTDDGRGDLIYRDNNGELLNLTTLGR